MIEPNINVDQLSREARACFEDQFGRPPQWIVLAPGRVNLIGEHIDYNDGYVLPMAIERYVVLAAGPAEGHSAAYRLHSMTSGQTEMWPADAAPAQGKGGWSSYVWGVLDLCRQQGWDTGPLHIVIRSTVPVGGGLSSSAALEVATATLVEAVTGHVLDPIDKALLCQRAEHEYAGVPCGIMDQFSSVLGRANHLILLDCRSRRVELVPFDPHDVSVLITNSNVKHALTGGEYAQRRGQCEEAARRLGLASLRECAPDQLARQASLLDPDLARRARHVVGEIDRTVRAADAIRQADWERAGDLMYESHVALRDDYEVSCAELDLLVKLAGQIGRSGGVYGSRMTGAGFGGCTVSLVRSQALASIAQQIRSQYFAQTGIEPTMLVSLPAEGCRVMA